MSFSPITHLRHVDLAVPNYEKQVAFYRDHWGLTPTSDGSGLSYFAAEGSPEQFIVRVRDAADKRIDLISFGVANRAAADALAQELAHAGVQLITEPGTLQTPGGGYGFRFFDLEGRTIEISADVATRKHRQIEAREAIPVRLSHVVVNSPQPEKTRAWYERHLGFRCSDTLNHPHAGDLFYFMRCGPQHHIMAIARGPHAALQHLSFEFRGIDEYMRASGRLLRAGWEQIWGPGRHRAGDNTFAYFLDANGNTMECTTELEVIDEDKYHPHIYSVLEAETSDQWGTSSLMNEFITQKMFNEPDKGLHQAPPV